MDPQEPQQPTPEVKVEPSVSTDILSPEAKRIIKKEREEARQAAETRLAEDLGVAPAEAKRIIAEAREREESQQTEVQKAARKLETVQKEHQATREELEAAYAHIAQMSQENALRGALSEAGIKAGRIKAALRLADMDLLEVDGNGNVTGMDDAVKAIQEESPEWFEGSEPEPVRRAPDATRANRYGSGGDAVKSFNERLRAQGMRQ